MCNQILASFFFKVCDGCGGNTHYRKDCKFGQSGHPEFVKTRKWSESELSKKVDRLNWKTTSDISCMPATVDAIVMRSSAKAVEVMVFTVNPALKN